MTGHTKTRLPTTPGENSPAERNHTPVVYLMGDFNIFFDNLFNLIKFNYDHRIKKSTLPLLLSTKLTKLLNVGKYRSLLRRIHTPVEKIYTPAVNLMNYFYFFL